MASNTIKENKMGVMPVKKLIISMALPMMISMLVQALYNVVDSIFVARLGENNLRISAAESDDRCRLRYRRRNERPALPLSWREAL